jgi:hypothetical protein
MDREYIRMRSTTEREKLLARAKETLGEDTDAAAIDAALAHLVESAENFEDVKREVPADLAERLSTDVVRLVTYPQVRTD